MANDFITLCFAQKIQESEKAVKLELQVSWNANCYTRAFWFPKSVLTMDGDRFAVKSWFYDKLERDNAFHGYRMTIDNGFIFTEEA